MERDDAWSCRDQDTGGVPQHWSGVAPGRSFDDGTPIGLDIDGFDNEDKMALHLTNLVNDRMGPNASTYMT